ncbi:MAG: Phosphoglucomutase-3 [Candelina mexicana]|nr:MAG: Phosphoglucomutase-3 [Candelina mexicana]
MEAGYSRINCLTIIQTSQGLASYLLKTIPHAEDKGIVIGYDTRHNSEKFAKLAAATFVAKRIKVWYYEECVHTPLVPFAVKELQAAAGVMITASHVSKGAIITVPGLRGLHLAIHVRTQLKTMIIPPHDAGIASAILENLRPERISWDLSVVNKAPILVKGILARISEKYYNAVLATSDSSFVTKEIPKPKFVYTPLHGVGLPYMSLILQKLGLLDGMVTVDEQAGPDPDFPTVEFPNPEEVGALSLAFTTADRHGIELIIANDPDADRYAVAEKVDGTWHQFTGDQLGVLFASEILSRYPAVGNRSKLAMLTSTVSTSMLRSMASREGFHVEETLTGFKWLGNVALELKEKGYDACYAFEEAIGYMFSDVVYDKDGIAAGAIFLTAATKWMAQEKLTPWGKLQQLYEKYGYFENANTSIRMPDRKEIDARFEEVRALGNPYPTTLGKRGILRWRDLTDGFDSDTPDNVPTLPVSKDTQMITCELEEQVRFTIRSSGTELKIKRKASLFRTPPVADRGTVYVECQAQNSAQARQIAEEVAVDLRRCWFGKPDGQNEN